MLPSAKKDCVPTTHKFVLFMKFCADVKLGTQDALGRDLQTMKQRTHNNKEGNTAREEPPRICKDDKSKINCGHDII